MSLSLSLALIWLIAANVIGMVPCKRKHWPQAYLLITIGAPLLFWVFWQDGWLTGALILVAALSILRWPFVYLMRWLRVSLTGAARNSN